MADLPISSAASLTHTTIAVGDLFPLVDISAAAGSKGSKITLTELAASVFTVGSTVRTTFSQDSVAGASALLFSGAVFTGGTSTTTKPHFLIEPAGTPSTGWSTDGTLLGLNASSGFAGSLLDLQVNGVSKFRINSSGDIQPGSDRGIQFLTQNGTWIATLGTNGDPQINLGTLGINYSRGKWDNSGLWVSQNRYIAFTDSEQGGAVDTRLYRTEAAVLAVRGGATSTGGAIELLEQTAPAAGSANTVRLYAVDNGAGKTQLMALFSSGAAQQIAIQP